MAQPPAHHQFVKLRQPFADINPVAMMMLILVEFVARAGARFESLPLGRAFAGWRKFAHRLQRPEEYVTQRGFFEASLQACVSLRCGPVITEHLLVLQAAEKFNLSKLFRLKSAGGLQQATKREKMPRQHRFQDRELLH